MIPNICDFRHPPGVLECIPAIRSGGYYIKNASTTAEMGDKGPSVCCFPLVCKQNHSSPHPMWLFPIPWEQARGFSQSVSEPCDAGPIILWTDGPAIPGACPIGSCQCQCRNEISLTSPLTLMLIGTTSRRLPFLSCRS